ncbi:hypothetical protein PFISCL1PPCAC_19690, partial [Pristionchus fissidentatus]
ASKAVVGSESRVDKELKEIKKLSSPNGLVQFVSENNKTDIIARLKLVGRYRSNDVKVTLKLSPSFPFEPPHLSIPPGGIITYDGKLPLTRQSDWKSSTSLISIFTELCLYLSNADDNKTIKL